MDVEAWSSRDARPLGLWVSNGRDWSDLRAVSMGTPFESVESIDEAPGPVHIEAAGGAITIYFVDASGHDLWSSTDIGRSWAKVTTR